MNISIMPLVRLRYRMGLLDWRDIPWNSLPDWARYAVMDADGTWTAHKSEPIIDPEWGKGGWLPACDVRGFSDTGPFVTTGPWVEFEWVDMGDWRNSMVCRPYIKGEAIR
jgi:hypothetical protein